MVLFVILIATIILVFPPRNIEGRGGGGGGEENNIIEWLTYSFLINILGKLHFKPHMLEVILN